MSEDIDYKARYERLCAAVNTVADTLQDTTRLLEITAQRMTSTSANCMAAARTLKHAEHMLIVAVRHE